MVITCLAYGPPCVFTKVGDALQLLQHSRSCLYGLLKRGMKYGLAFKHSGVPPGVSARARGCPRITQALEPMRPLASEGMHALVGDFCS